MLKNYTAKKLKTHIAAGIIIFSLCIYFLALIITAREGIRSITEHVFWIQSEGDLAKNENRKSDVPQRRQ